MVKHIPVLFCFQWLLTLFTYAGENRYPVSAIDTSLLRNASMVVRLHDRVIEVKSLNYEVVKTHYVLTILKGSAAENAVFKVWYDDYSSVDVFKGSMYDASGKLVRNFNSKDISDVSAIGDGILYSDDRLKIIRPVLGFYPVTVEFFSEVTFKRILVYPSFQPQDDYEQAIEKSSLEIIADEEPFPRFKEVRIPDNTIITGDGKTGKKWEFRGIRARIREPLSPSLEDLVPVIYLNPVTYNIQGYKGDFSTWQGIGMWVKSLNAGRDSLPPDVANQVRNLVKGIADPLEKVKKIYSHMQQTTRFVAINIGIGGLQPEPAEMVARMGYGDCKGLVNYTLAMLKCAGIPSRAVLVSAGDNAGAIQLDFPGNQFNHVILSVPLEKDTIWLECTNQHKPFGFLGSFTDNRDALLLDPKGGVIVHTPAYSRNDNTIQRKTTISVDSTGSAMVELNSCYRGLIYDDVQEMLYLAPEKQKEELIDRYRIPGLKILSYSCSSVSEKIPSISENIVMEIAHYASVNGSRLFIPLASLLNPEKNLPRVEPRVCDLVLQNSYTISDSVVIDLPEGYHIETRPVSGDIKGDFGELRTGVSEMGPDVLFTRHFEREEGRFLPASFNDYVDFMKQVSKQDNKKLVIIRN